MKLQLCLKWTLGPFPGQQPDRQMLCVCGEAEPVSAEFLFVSCGVVIQKPLVLCVTAPAKPLSQPSIG